MRGIPWQRGRASAAIRAPAAGRPATSPSDARYARSCGGAPGGCARRTPSRSRAASGARPPWRRRASPSPTAGRGRKRPMGEDDDRRVAVDLREIGRQPRELRLRRARARVATRCRARRSGRPCGRTSSASAPKNSRYASPAVERCVVLAGHEADVFTLSADDDVLELGHPLAPHRRVVGRVREVAGEDDEVGLALRAR